jgi:hypothetical protein
VVGVRSSFNAPPHVEARHRSIPGGIHSIATSLPFPLLLGLIRPLVSMCTIYNLHGARYK